MLTNWHGVCSFSHTATHSFPTLIEDMTMTTIAIQDLNLGKALDRQAMAKLHGGYTYTGSDYSDGSWNFVSQWTENGGFRQIGFIKYKVDKLHKKYQRTQTRIDHYEQLTVVLG